MSHIFFTVLVWCALQHCSSCLANTPKQPCLWANSSDGCKSPKSSRERKKNLQKRQHDNKESKKRMQCYAHSLHLLRSSLFTSERICSAKNTSTKEDKKRHTSARMSLVYKRSFSTCISARMSSHVFFCVRVSCTTNNFRCTTTRPKLPQSPFTFILPRLIYQTCDIARHIRPWKHSVQRIQI